MTRITNVNDDHNDDDGCGDDDDDHQLLMMVITMSVKMKAGEDHNGDLVIQ